MIPKDQLSEIGRAISMNFPIRFDILTIAKWYERSGNNHLVLIKALEKVGDEYRKRMIELVGQEVDKLVGG